MSLDFSFRCTRLSDTMTVNKTAETTDPNVIDTTVSVANGQTDKEVVLAIDVSQLKAIFIASNAAVLVQTNSGSAPDDEITLAANVPYIWMVGSADACLIQADVTKIYVTNASGGAATIQIRVLQDGTP